MNHRKMSVVAGMLATLFVVTPTFADWTQFSLPNLADAYSPTAIAVLPNGSYVFANEGTYYQQNAFGSAGYTAYSNVSPGNNADPSFLAVWNGTNAVAGGGTFGPSDLYSFNPASLSAPAFTAQGLSLQNYSGVFRDANSLYVGGGNGSDPNGFGGSMHSISYVNLNTETTKVIIDNISTFSTGFAEDAAGNLYVGDEDNDNVYKFTAAQLTLAITGSPLTTSDGTLLYHSINSLGTVAVDGLGRIWSSGYLANGLQMYDPGTGLETTMIPGLTNANYMVTTFSLNGQSYVAYTDQVDPSQPGTAQYYGFVVVPEPATWCLALVGLTALVALRRKTHRGT